MSVVPDAADFDEFYYRNCCGQPYERNQTWMAFFGKIADRIVSDIAPKTVLDAGCAIGLLVEALRDRGVDARGIDLSSWAIEHAPEKVRPFVREGSIAEPFDARYDLIVCIEVLEHMPPDEADRAIANFAAHADDVIFSSTPFDYKEPTHVNVRMPEDWAEAFARHGLYRDVDFDASYITKWAARLTRRSVPAQRLVRDYERRFWQLRLAEQDARQYSVEIQDRLASTEGDRDRQRTERNDFEQQLSAAHAHIKALTIANEDLETDVNELRQKMGSALDTIRNMESSAFWRLRLAINRLLRRQ
jgi:2-polyprenyl-3-methyl-5-hydroxy-6-metoxy-1,4-benzoquinol methylase